MKLYEFIDVINSDCLIDDWKIVTTEGKQVKCNIQNYYKDEVVDIYWHDAVKTEEVNGEVKVISASVKVITIAHYEVEYKDFEHRFYACFEDFDGATKKIPCNTREEARAIISREYNPEKHKQIWTE